MRKDQQFIQKLKEKYPNRLKDECVSISILDEDFIKDDKKGQSCYFTRGIPDGFQIINNNEKEINLLALDDCFFTQNDEKRCDGIVFDDVDLCFFELNFEMESSRGKRKKKKFFEAIEQLESTFQFFGINTNQTSNDFCGLNIKAYICMKANSYPSNPATIKQKRVDFLERNRIPLIDKNRKEF